MRPLMLLALVACSPAPPPPATTPAPSAPVTSNAASTMAPRAPEEPEPASTGPTRPMVVRAGKIFVKGSLPPEVINRVVRKEPKLRACYEDGLTRNPKLEGRVSVGVVIDAKGVTRSAADNGSEMPDAKVRDCVVKIVGGFSYPPPSAGDAAGTATIPIVFLAPE